MSISDDRYYVDPLNQYIPSTDGATITTAGATWVPTPSWAPAANIKVENKEQAIAMINIRIADLAKKAARLARLREFFETMSSNQNDIIKEFWETVKKELD